MLEKGNFINNRYEIINPVGAGGMSDVYKAKDHKLNRNVAIKVLKTEYSKDKNFVSKFRVEAQSAASLIHPNIVNVYDVGEDDGTWNTSENAKYAGLKRKTYLYDNSNEEDESKLIESSIAATEKANGTDTLNINFTTDEASLFDYVGSKEEITGIEFKEQITKKVLKVTISGIISHCKFEYKVGD